MAGRSGAARSGREAGRASPGRPAGRVALVTGAGRGIGAAVALAYAREGADLVLASRTDAELVAVAGAARALGATAHAVSADVAAPR